MADGRVFEVFDELAEMFNVSNQEFDGARKKLFGKAVISIIFHILKLNYIENNESYLKDINTFNKSIDDFSKIEFNNPPLTFGLVKNLFTIKAGSADFEHIEWTFTGFVSDVLSTDERDFRSISFSQFLDAKLEALSDLSTC